jgi:hypothetical protein
MRAKIILPNFIAVLILGLASYFFLRHDLEKKADNALRFPALRRCVATNC